MTDFYIFRHGDTINTERPQILHREDTHKMPILPKGTRALKKIGSFLKEIPLDENFCSPYLRCQQSAKIVFKATNNKYKIDSRISELEGREKFSDFCNRVFDFLSEVKQKNYSSISICTHGAVIAAVKHLALGKKFHFFQLFDYPKPGNLVIIKEGKINTTDFNT